MTYTKNGRVETMKRSEAIEEMIKFVQSTPEEASDYHKMDMLLSRIKRIGVVLTEFEEEEEYKDNLYEYRRLK